MPANLNSSYALKLLPRFRRRLRSRKQTLAPAQIKALAMLIAKCSHFEERLLYATICEGYDRGKFKVLLPFSTPKRFSTDLGEMLTHDTLVIDKIYSRKLSNNIVGYQSMHYYENTLRNAVSNYLSETISANWHRDLLASLALDFELFPDEDGDGMKVKLEGWRELKFIIEPDLVDSAVLDKNTFDQVFSMLRKHFARLAKYCKNEDEVRAKIHLNNSRQFLRELSISDLQKWVLKDWSVYINRPEFFRARENEISWHQLRSYFRVISEYRNSTYHHVSDGGAPAAVRRIRRIIDMPKEYTRFIGPDVPMIANPANARRIADTIFEEMPTNLRNGTSIEFLRYLARRYPLEILRKGFVTPVSDSKRVQQASMIELEQFRPPGLRSLYARRLEASIRVDPMWQWVWWS